MRQTSSSVHSTLTTATPTIGGMSGAFDVATLAAPVVVTLAPLRQASSSRMAWSDFTTSNCTPGSTIAMVITYLQALPLNTVYWKYGPTPTDASYDWYQLPATIAGNTATFSITDGGLGDDDLTANGIIVDQGGPGAGGTASIPTLSEWALLMLAGLMGLFGMTQVRQRKVPGL